MTKLRLSQADLPHSGDVLHCFSDYRPLQTGRSVEQLHAEIAQLCHISLLQSVNPFERTETVCRQPGFTLALALETPQWLLWNRIPAGTDQLRTQLDIAETQVDALSGERVHAVRRIAHQPYPALQPMLAAVPAQRKTSPLTGADNLTQTMLEGAAECFTKSFVIVERQAFGECIIAGPDDGTLPVSQG